MHLSNRIRETQFFCQILRGRRGAAAPAFASGSAVGPAFLSSGLSTRRNPGRLTKLQNYFGWLTITRATGGATIRYTINGSTHSETVGTLYGGPASIGSTTTLEDIAYESGMTGSSVTSALYTIKFPAAVAAPTFSPAAGHTVRRSRSPSAAQPAGTRFATPPTLLPVGNPRVARYPEMQPWPRFPAQNQKTPTSSVPARGTETGCRRDGPSHAGLRSGKLMP